MPVVVLEVEQDLPIGGRHLGVDLVDILEDRREGDLAVGQGRFSRFGNALVGVLLQFHDFGFS